MRRIPRPQRAIDPSQPLVRPRISPSPCRSLVAPGTHLRTTSAAFSTSTSYSFLLSGKQDKKKHQQFVRRWQKRLLGDSEPIGAHVDPYDPTSPVRISPEEYGEEVEVIEDDAHADGQFYRPVERGWHLQHVGGKEWREQMREASMAKEFEKMTLRTYTPLSLTMANEIEDLTGSPYTLQDNNLMMAQAVHEATGKPYTHLNFGVTKRVTDTETDRLRNSFRQAIAEVYTLNQANLDMDVSKLSNRGIYQAPKWVKDIKLYRTDSGELALYFPHGHRRESFLEVMQQAPEWDPAEILDPFDHELDEVLDYGELSPANEAQTAEPVMDPNTPPERRAAMVKQDEDKKPFDFMSNRPVPRKQPVEAPKVEEPVKASRALPASSSLDLDAKGASRTIVNASGNPADKDPEQIIKEKASSPKHVTAESMTTPTLELSPMAVVTGPEAKWRDVPLTEPAIKFALFKRLLQLTGIRLSDAQLSAANTLGDLYGYLCDAVKPKPATLFQKIHVGGQKARHRANQTESMNAEKQKKADLGDLITLGNVEVRRMAITAQEERTRTGLEKVVQYALAERGLGGRGPRKHKQKRRGSVRVIEGTRRVPVFGQPVSGAAANYLAEKTAEIREKARTGQIST